jgi:hypothetical protein
MEILGVALDERGAEVVKPFAERTKINSLGLSVVPSSSRFTA